MQPNRQGVQPIADILRELVARRGFSRLRSQEQLEEVWSAVIGQPGCHYTRVGPMRRGVLEVLVANSVLLQELAGFQKHTLLAKLQEKLGPKAVRDIQFRIDSAH